MSTIYHAYANGKEIKNFYVGGKEISEVWGGDTLLWKKSDGKLPMKEICSIRTTWTQIDNNGIQYPSECELSVRNQTEDGSIYFTDIEKAGIYVKQVKPSTSGGAYLEQACIMFKATRNPSGTYFVPQKNVLRTLRRWNMKGELLDETEEWEYSRNYGGINGYTNIFGAGSESGGVFNISARPVNYGPGPSSVSFPPTVYTSGSGSFKSAEDVVKYMLE